MAGLQHQSHGSGQLSGFWRSPAGLALAAFLAIVAVFLIYEHRVHLFAGGYGNVFLFVAAVAAHGLMHRRHGATAATADPASPQTPGKRMCGDDRTRAIPAHIHDIRRMPGGAAAWPPQFPPPPTPSP